MKLQVLQPMADVSPTPLLSALACGAAAVTVTAIRGAAINPAAAWISLLMAASRLTRR